MLMVRICQVPVMEGDMNKSEKDSGNLQNWKIEAVTLLTSFKLNMLGVAK